MQPSLIWIKTAGSSTPPPCLSDLPAKPKAGTPTSPSCRRLPGERRCFLSFSCWPRAHCLWIISASHPTRSDVFSLTITQKFFHLQQGIEPFQSGTDFEIGSFFILNHGEGRFHFSPLSLVKTNVEIGQGDSSRCPLAFYSDKVFINNINPRVMPVPPNSKIFSDLLFRV